MTTKHTHGPWIATGWENIIVNSAQGVTLCLAPQGAEGETLKTIQANARLIAAAPDLLAALELIAPIYAHIDPRDNSPFGVTGRAVNAAIAKAKGTTA